MSHCDPSTLALAALGERVDGADEEHLASCPTCSMDAAELVEVVTLAREAPALLPEVPERVWAGITTELDLDIDAESTDSRLSAPLASASDAATPAASEATTTGHGNVVSLDQRRRRPAMWAIASAAAMAGAVIGGAVVWSAVDRGTDGSRTPDAFVAQAVLAPLTDTVPAPGDASVVDSPDGEVVRVDARALPDSDGFYEVWLLDSAGLKMVALGALPAGSVGTFTLPPGLSIDEYPVVDISLESYDGDPTHSTNSLMRGVLET